MITKSVKVLLILTCIISIAEKVKSSDSCESMKLSAAHSLGIQKALAGAWPWMTAIYNSSTNEYKFSGSLISKEHVLIGKLH